MNNQVMCVERGVIDSMRIDGFRKCVLWDLAAKVNGKAVARDRSEVDAVDGNEHRYKQLCTYALVVRQGKVLAYRRSSHHDRPDLASQWSVGVGGHVDPEDYGGGFSSSIYRAALREILEEIGVQPRWLSFAGLVNEEKDAGIDHLGLVFVAVINASDNTIWSEEMTTPGFVYPSALWPSELEPWSRIVMDAVRDGSIPIA